MFTKLNKDGYILLHGLVDIQEQNQGKNCITKTKIKYPQMTKFIMNSIISKVNTKLGWDCVVTKYRVSDNNNSSDAGSFHRDIFKYGNVDKEVENIFTVLLYLDDAVMELIPGSHRVVNAKYKNIISWMKKAIQIKMTPGDVLIFHSTLIHRGVFYINPSGHRRLIQIFEVFNSPQDANLYQKKIIHIPVIDNKNTNTSGNIISKLNKIYITNLILNHFGYINAITGYGYRPGIMKNLNLVQYDYFSSEGMQPRIHNEDLIDGYGPINRYYLLQQTDDIPLNIKNKIYWMQYLNQYLLYFIILIVFIVLIVYLIKNIYHKCR